MKIISIILEGFKSYSEVTKLELFDPRFTVITGRNGSGKSNILDAICFVLGLSSYSIIRAHSSLDLIYKSGQAGIKAARVTVVFCNRDKSQSPADLKDQDELRVAREITTDGTCYYLNDKRETNKRMHLLFKSIGLNIDNPATFFVQQGRVASIVNFKPKQLLEFLEESAGTAFYSSIKKSCLDTIETKREKVIAAEAVLKNLSAQSEERAREIEACNRWRAAEEKAKQLESRRELLDARAAELEVQLINSETTLSDSKLQLAQQRLENATRAARELHAAAMKHRDRRELEEEVANEANKEETLRTEIKDAEKRLTSERQKADNERLAEVPAPLEAARARERAAVVRREEAERLLAEAETLCLKRRRELAQLEGAGDQPKQQQLGVQRLRAEIADLTASIKAAKSEAAACEARAKEASSAAARSGHERETLRAEATALRDEATLLRAERADLEAKAAGLEPVARRGGGDIEDIARRRAAAGVAAVDIAWTARGRALNFGGVAREKAVRGRLVSLVTPKDPTFSAALEAAAGGKLLHVVVENDEVAETLVREGALEGKVTCLPLNKIRGTGVAPHVVAAAQTLAAAAGGRIWNPLELLAYPADIQRAVEYGWGDRLIASSFAAAQAVAFSKEAGLTVVTLEGEVVSPAGALEGGFRDKTTSPFALAAKLRELAEIAASAARQHAESAEARREIERIRSHISPLRAKLDQLEARRLACEDRLRGLADSSADEAEARERLAAAKRHVEDSQARIAEVEKLLAQGAGLQLFLQENETAEKRLLEAKTRLQEAALAETQATEELNYQLTRGAEAAKLRESRARQTELAEGALARLQADLAELRRSREKIERLLTARKDFDADVAQAAAEISTLTAEYEAMKMERQKRAARANELARKRANAGPSEFDSVGADEIEAMRGKIDSEAGAARRRADELRKFVDRDAELTNEKLDDGLRLNVERLKLVQRDRDTMTSNIGTLDTRREATILRGFEEVAAHFRTISARLLPAVEAQLELTEGPHEARGLKIRVAFGGAWRESLKELSGGQRSLLALAYILALLKFKPGPFYILDEVDAALDLAHTEKLGELFAQEFPQSQFVVISLREEFLSNAKVLFKVSAKEGRSAVERAPPLAPSKLAGFDLGNLRHGDAVIDDLRFFKVAEASNSNSNSKSRNKKRVKKNN